MTDEMWAEANPPPDERQQLYMKRGRCGSAPNGSRADLDHPRTCASPTVAEHELDALAVELGIAVAGVFAEAIVRGGLGPDCGADAFEAGLCAVGVLDDQRRGLVVSRAVKKAVCRRLSRQRT